MGSIALDFQPTPAPPSVRQLVELRPLARRDDGNPVLLVSYPDHHLFALQSFSRTESTPSASLDGYPDRAWDDQVDLVLLDRLPPQPGWRLQLGQYPHH